MDDETKEILLQILRVGLLRIRNFASAGNARECVVETDHLHNIPIVISQNSLELLSYYLSVEKPAYLSSCNWSVEEFEPLWGRLNGSNGTV